MRRLLRVILITSLLCLPSLTIAQTIFDVSGTITSLNGASVVGTFSGTFDISPAGVVDWNIAISGAVGAFTFTPEDSTGSLDNPDFEVAEGGVIFNAGQRQLDLLVQCFYGQLTPCISPSAVTPLVTLTEGGAEYYVPGSPTKSSITLAAKSLRSRSLPPNHRRWF